MSSKSDMMPQVPAGAEAIKKATQKLPSPIHKTFKQIKAAHISLYRKGGKVMICVETTDEGTKLMPAAMLKWFTGEKSPNEQLKRHIIGLQKRGDCAPEFEQIAEEVDDVVDIEEIATKMISAAHTEMKSIPDDFTFWEMVQWNREKVWLVSNK
jgi:hypothetical protein